MQGAKPSQALQRRLFPSVLHYLNTLDALIRQFLAVIDALFCRSCSLMNMMLVTIHPACMSVYENMAANW